MSSDSKTPESGSADLSCDQTAFIVRLAVDDPSALKKSPWRDHLDACRPCRSESSALEQSLAVFKHLESGDADLDRADIGWECFAKTLATNPGSRRRNGLLRLPATAAAGVLLAVLTGALFWQFQGPSGPQPPRAVTLKPDERLHLQRVLRRSLTDKQPITQVASKSPELPVKATSIPFLNGTGPNQRVPSVPRPRIMPQFRVLSGAERTLVDSQMLAPNGRNNAGRAPVVLFRTLRQMRSGVVTIRNGNRPLVLVQPAGNPVNNSRPSNIILPLSPR